MRKSTTNPRAFAAALCFLTAVGGGLSSLPASAASITYSDPVCSQFFVMPSTNGDVSLRCVQMACSIATNGSYIVTIGTPVTLTATCTPAATSYTWTIAGRSPQGCPAPAPANTQAVQVQSSTPMTCWYDVAAADGAGNQGTTRYGIVWTAGSPPSGCTIGTSPSPPSLPSSGGNVSMTVSCTSGAPFTSFAWHKNNANFGTNAATQNDTLPNNTATTPVNYTYNVSVCNANGCAAPVQTVFTVAGQTVSAGLCGQYQNVLQVDLPTGNPDQLTTNAQGFMANGVFVGRFVAGNSSAVAPGQINFSEYIDPSPYDRVLTISTQACDFRTFGTFQRDPTGNNAPLYWAHQGGPGQLPIQYTIAPIVSGTPPNTLASLTPGQTYYVNVRNIDLTGTVTCVTSTCNMLVQHVLPR